MRINPSLTFIPAMTVAASLFYGGGTVKITATVGKEAEHIEL